MPEPTKNDFQFAHRAKTVDALAEVGQIPSAEWFVNDNELVHLAKSKIGYTIIAMVPVEEGGIDGVDRLYRFSFTVDGFSGERKLSSLEVFDFEESRQGASLAFFVSDRAEQLWNLVKVKREQEKFHLPSLSEASFGNDSGTTVGPIGPDRTVVC